MKKNTKRKRETSYTKRLLAIFLGISVFMTILTVGMTILNFADESAISAMEVLAGEWLGGTAVFTGFYVWKSKNENRHKYAQLFIRELADKYGIEAAASFYEITVKED